MKDDDLLLLEEFRDQGDESAFRELVRRHLGLVHSVARRVTGSEELAKDVSQSTFIRLAAKAGRIPREVSLVAWLHRTARSTAIDCVRREAKRRKVETVAHSVQESRSDPDWQKMASAVDGLVDALKQKDREVILQRFYVGLSYPAIASRTGLTEQAARKRCDRALEKLRAKLIGRGLATSPAALAALLPSYANGAASPQFLRAVTDGALPYIGRAASWSSFKLREMGPFQKAAVVLAAFAALPLAMAVMGNVPGLPHGADGLAAGFSTAAGNGAVYQAKMARASSRALTEAESISQIRKWLVMTNAEAAPIQLKGTFGTLLYEAMNGLPVAVLDGLLADRELFTHVRGTDTDDQEDLYPLRRLIHHALWVRYSELSPQVAAAQTFQGGHMVDDIPADAVLEGISKVDPEFAYGLWSSVRGTTGDAFDDGYNLISVMENWAKRDPRAFADRMTGFDLWVRQSAWGAYTETLKTGSDWAGEVKLFDQLFRGNVDADGLYSLGGSLVSRWAVDDPDAAFEWLGSLASQGASGSDVRMVFLWLKADPLHAPEWLQTWTPNGGSRDEVFSDMLGTYACDDPDITEAILGLIEDPARRNEVVLKISGSVSREVKMEFEKSERLPKETRDKIAADRREIDERILNPAAGSK